MPSRKPRVPIEAELRWAEERGDSLPAVRTCDFCGKQAAETETMTWVTSVENGRRKTYCDTCSREHLRAIEGKLDSEWW
jgi:hypothetical protein